MGLKLNGATSGSIEIDVPAVAGTDTAITIPATSGGEFIVSDSAGDVNLDNGTFFVDASTNRCGIGTTSPANNLHVNAASATIDLQDSGATNSIGRFINASGSLYIQSQNNTSHGNIVLRTSDGSSALERARINSSGRLTAQYDGAALRSHSRANNAYQFAHNDASTDVFWVNVTTTSYAAAAIRASVYRSNTSSFTFAQYTSGNLADDEFIFRGDGKGFADVSFTGGGADYAEYFEWSDGNTGAEDRRGISVVLDGDKIREAVAGEEPIGVISGNPSVVGDAAWNKWNGKYLRDDFGTYIRNAEGERQLNPDYDPDVEYISRENRPEWDCVGLMGKLRIRKGQVTGARWIKMRDVSDTVEEWLVR